MICLTFDTDHMRQEDMERFLEERSLPGQVTFFAHQYFSSLEATDHEICPHPFIRSFTDWEKEVIEIAHQFSIRPKGIRFHSCVLSHTIAAGLKRLGYEYSSNIDHLFRKDLQPYRHSWGIWELPIYYMDNMDFCMSDNWPYIDHTPFDFNIIKTAVKSDGLFVFDLHPLHIAINTHDYATYLKAREKMSKDGESPFNLRYGKRGVAVFFDELCSAIVASGQRSYSCKEALEFFGCISEDQD
jgi:hypothetical protein